MEKERREVSGLVDRSGEDLLRFAATTGELRQVVRAFDALGIEHGNVLLTVRDGSPWLEADVATGPVEAIPFPPPDPSVFDLVRLALWRRTGAVYVVGSDGAVADDPVPGCEGTL